MRVGRLRALLLRLRLRKLAAMPALAAAALHQRPSGRAQLHPHTHACTPYTHADIDADARQAAASEAVARLWGEGAGYDTLLPDSGFDAGSFSVWATPVEDMSLASWQRLAEFKLGE